MVNYCQRHPADETMDTVFSALADTTRRGMIARLSRGPASVGELGDPYPITKPAITKHVKLLERAGLVRRDRDGRIHRLTLQPEPMRRAGEWIERYRRFWEASLGSLAEYVEQINRTLEDTNDEPNGDRAADGAESEGPT